MMLWKSTLDRYRSPNEGSTVTMDDLTDLEHLDEADKEAILDEKRRRKGI